MAELVDAYVSEAYAFTGVRVRLPLPAPFFFLKGCHSAAFFHFTLFFIALCLFIPELGMKACASEPEI